MWKDLGEIDRCKTILEQADYTAEDYSQFKVKPV